MTTLGVFLAIVGVLIVATRGPLAVAPVSTRTFYLQFLKTDAALRAWAVFAVLLGLAAVFVARGVEGAVATATLVVGSFIAAASLAGVFFTSRVRAFAERVWAEFGVGSLRAIGVGSAGFGLLLIYFGLRV
jgi:hypothetical protein